MNILILLFALFPLVAAVPWYNDPLNLVCFYPLIDGSFADATTRTTAIVTPSPPPPPVAVNAMGTVFNNPANASIAVQWNGPMTFSVSLMLRFNNVPNATYLLLGSSAADSTTITVLSSALVVTMGSGTATYPFTWSVTKWQHLTVAFDSTLMVAVDGQQLSSTSTSGVFSLSRSSAAILLGDAFLALPSAPVAIFNFRQFVSSLSAEQASEVHAADLAQLCSPSPVSIFPQCLQSFETPVVVDYQYYPSFASWAFNDNDPATGTGGIATIGGTYDPANSAAPPDGVQYAFIQNVGAWTEAHHLVANLSNLVVGAPYHVAFSYNVREAGFVSENSDIYLFCDGAPSALFDAFYIPGPPADWISVVSRSFVANQDTTRIRIYTENQDLYANNTFLIDAVVVVPE